MARSRLLVPVAALAAALPAVVAAAPGPRGAGVAPGLALSTAPFLHAGYAWTVRASPGLLAVTAVRRAPGVVQTHTYLFTGVVLTVSPTLSGALLSARLGRYGSFAAMFHGTGRLRPPAAGPACGARVLARAGTLAGFRFTADRTSFRLVSRPLVGATLTRSDPGGRLPCPVGGPPPPAAGSLVLQGAAPGARAVSLAVVRTPAGDSTQTVTVVERGPAVEPATVTHVLQADATPDSVSVADDLSSATVTAPGGPLSGSLVFAAAAAPDEPAAGTPVAGTLAGDYAATFDSLGPTVLAAVGPLPATLLRG